MASFVPLAVAKAHLYITDPASDADVTVKLRHASAIVAGKCDTYADPLWDETTAPDAVQAATLLMLAFLWEHRGDDLAPDPHGAAVWNTITMLLKQWAAPTVA